MRSSVPGWVVQMVEDVIGGSPLEVGKVYVHPEDGLIKITSGQYWGQAGISNFWYWEVLETGETKHGYGGSWPEHIESDGTKPTDELTGMHVVLVGNPFDGLEVYGPFDTGEEAMEWADAKRLDSDWWSVALNHPADL